jgi:iron complex outermembrane recepter protein
VVTPSLSVTESTRGGGDLNPMIRGQRAFLPAVNQEQAVGVYFAEVGQAFAAGNGASFYDLDSVQVLKGPQGTLFGKNTTGGAIVITPKAPTDDFEGYGQLQTGSYSLVDFEGAVNVPVTDTLAIRVSGKLTHRDGYLTDPYRRNGGDPDTADDLNSNAARIITRWTPSDSFESTALAYYYESDTRFALQLETIGPNLTPLIALTGVLPEDQQLLSAAGKYGFDNAEPLYNDVWTYGVQDISKLSISSDPDQLDVRNIIGYREVGEHSLLDAVALPQPFLTSIVDGDYNQFSEEPQVIGRSGPVKFVAGFFYARLAASETQFAQLFKAAAPIFPTIAPINSYSADYDYIDQNYAPYGHVDWQLPEGVTLSAGLRYTIDDKSFTYHDRVGVSPTLGLGGPFLCTVTGVVNPTSSRSACTARAPDIAFEKLTYDAAVSWQVDERNMIYAAYKRGFREGGYNISPISIAAIPDSTFRPETIDEYEVGTKSDFAVGGVKGRFDLAVYHDKASNLQRTVTEVLPGTLITSSEVLNAASAHTNGGEAELTLKSATGITLQRGAAIIDARYDKFTDTYLVNNVPTAVNVADSKFAFVPSYQFNGSARYELPINEHYGEVAVQMSYYYQASVETDEINTTNCGPNGQYTGCLNRLQRLGAYGVANGRVEWLSVAGSHVDAAFFVNNMFDRYYSTAAGNLLSVLGLARVYRSPPRMFGVELRMAFGKSS